MIDRRLRAVDHPSRERRDHANLDRRDRPHPRVESAPARGVRPSTPASDRPR